VPEYCTKLTRAQGDKPQKNLIYVVSDNIYVHIYSEPGGGRPVYIPIEPDLTQDLNQALLEVESRLVDVACGMSAAESEAERGEAILKLMDMVCVVSRNGSNNSLLMLKITRTATVMGAGLLLRRRCRWTAEQLEALR